MYNMHNVKMNVPPQWKMCPYSIVEFPHVHQTLIFTFKTSWTLSLSYMNYAWKNKNTCPCMGTSSTGVGDYCHYLLHPCRNIICCMHVISYITHSQFSYYVHYVLWKWVGYISPLHCIWMLIIFSWIHFYVD